MARTPCFLRLLHSTQIAGCWALMDVCVRWPKNSQLHYPREGIDGEWGLSVYLEVWLLPPSSKSVLIKLCHSVGPTRLWEWFIQNIHKAPVPSEMSVCVFVCPLFIKLEEWQAVFFRQCLNTERSMPDKEKRVEGEGCGRGQHNWLLTENSKSKGEDRGDSLGEKDCEDESGACFIFEKLWLCLLVCTCEPLFYLESIHA